MTSDRGNGNLPHRLPESGPRLSGRPLTGDVGQAGPEPKVDDVSVGLFATDSGDQRAAVVTVRGEVDLASAGSLREVLRRVVDRATDPVVVDLSEVSFMGSTGVHLLVETYQRLKPQHRRLSVVCRERGQVHGLWALVGLLTPLNVHRSLDSAVTDGDEVIRSGIHSTGAEYGAGANPQCCPTRPCDHAR